jgi:hypothetical protein
MLTQHNYQNIDPNWDKDTILECCNPENPGGTPCTDCCYDSWENELTKVVPAYNAIVELASQYQTRVDFVTSRRDRYKSWVDEFTKAEGLARDICYQLKLIATQSDKIWFNTCEAEKAIEILFCMIRDIYMQVDELKTLYDSIQNCISRNNDPALNKGQGIFKYLDDYKTKLDATVKTRDDVIKSITLAVQLSSLIRNGISTRDCPKASDPPYNPCAPDLTPCVSIIGTVYYGFKTVICEWYNAFACDTPCADPATPPPPAATTTTTTTTADCNPDCELIPTFDFPICNNSFKTDVQGWVDADNTLLVTLTTQLNDAKTRREALLACKTSLDTAIKAVDPAARCK